MEFHHDVVRYFNAQATNADEETHEVRRRLNLAIDEVSGIVRAAGMVPVLVWTPPPAIGGYETRIDLFDNLFNLERYSIPPTMVTDYLKRALGVYSSDYRAAVVRTANPLWWFGQFLVWFARLPFVLIGAAGFNASRVEGSVFGRVAKGVLVAVPIGASALGILKALGWLEVFRFALGS